MTYPITVSPNMLYIYSNSVISEDYKCPGVVTLTGIELVSPCCFSGLPISLILVSMAL